ncbi:SDR family oxidoreductase [Nonomuraea sp. 3-1Str]|uniref:SDR family oxidoreductase n=1 Tax=Nonomuraea sp. 3-1Str TaxID=2929801 RepID=UPI002867920F|nr:SDR family oxidoreductase [Nonomuraea sp. 3-1Str]MDR8411335.1 SDR family oxidoreductase [Nonomuraea sp. 3-1Str]
MTLRGKTALVTGASRGIGRAIAQRLAADGALVVVHYGSNEAAAQETISLIENTGGNAFAVRAELGVPADVDTLFAGLEAGLRERTGRVRLDIVVNNAAVGAPGSIESISPAEFDRLFAVNTKAPLFIAQRALPLMNDGGRIINVSSAATRIALPELAYAMSKAAVNVFGRTLANAVGTRGITVNTVTPGPTETDANPWMRGNPQAQKMVASSNAIPRVGQPEDIADVVGFLASDAGRWVTGQVIDASGGCFLGPHM